jgi:membrane protein
VTYYLLLALFPALAALVSVYGLVANPADVAKTVQSLSGMLPPSTVELIGNELAQFVSASSKSLGLGAVIGIAIALWSGVRGMTGMMTALQSVPILPGQAHAAPDAYLADRSTIPRL